MLKLKDERGIVLPMAVMVLAIVALLGYTAFNAAHSYLHMGSRYTGNEAAMAIADAGIQEFLWHLNHDAVTHPDQPFYQLHGQANPLTASYGGGSYRTYALPFSGDGPVELISTGWPSGDPGNRYSIQATLRKRPFTQYLYLSNSETDSGSGESVFFSSGDQLEGGPVATKGDLHIKGRPLFSEEVLIGGKLDNQSDSNISAVFPQGYRTNYPLTAIDFPQSNSQLKGYTGPHQDGVSHPAGGYYSGRTCIFLHDGRYDASYWNGSRIVNKTNQPFPANGVIYVDNAPGFKGPTDFNHTEATLDHPDPYDQGKFDPKLGNLFVSGELDGRLTIAAANDIFLTDRDPTNPDYDGATVTHGLTYAGGDPNSHPNCDDMLGLVANNYIRVLKSNWPQESSPYYFNYHNNQKYWDVTTDSTFTIYAALLSVNKGLEYENINKGHVVYKVIPLKLDLLSDPLSIIRLLTDLLSNLFDILTNLLREGITVYVGVGTPHLLNLDLLKLGLDFRYTAYPPIGNKGTLQLVGSLVQNNDGFVQATDQYKQLLNIDPDLLNLLNLNLKLDLSAPKTIASGWSKDYHYDRRMRNNTPPHFLEPATAGWYVDQWRRVASPAF